MNLQNPSARACTREQIGEASVWMAMLRDADRTAQFEHGFRTWLAADPGNTAAFETISQAWEEAAGLPRIPIERLPQSRKTFRRRILQAATITAALIITGISSLVYQRHFGFATDVGEQRTLTLSDGSRVSLNTDTRVVVQYDEATRRIALKRGEALFDVSNQPSRPFVVLAGGREIRALGTSFVVREDAHGLAVTLLSGEVSVAQAAERSAATTDVLLTPGQRLRLKPDSRPALDQPPLEKVIAWRTGQVDLADERLADAAAEMNRYSRTKVVIEDAQTAGIRIMGVFRAGDTASFANAIADTYGLKVEGREGLIVIRGSVSR